MTGLFSLQGSVQHYEWGGQQFLPALVNRPQDQQPWAELWLGAHPKAPSLINGSSLAEAIGDSPEVMLGRAVAEQFATLPFLLKVLDVEKMLSIQVHPTLAQAREGFLREELQGMAMDAPDRNYRDQNHKPELMVALSDFWLLHGFRTIESACACLGQHPELTRLAEQLERMGMDAFYREVMLHPGEQLFTTMAALADRLRQLPEISKHKPDYWFLKAVDSAGGQLEPGMLSIYLLNLVFMQEGEGIFQDAGIPHAYLYGQNIEIMANSDNVLRAGLTPKHIDVPELLSIIRTEAVYPEILYGAAMDAPINASNKEWVYYPAPVTDFSLEQVSVEQTTLLEWPARSEPMVLLVMAGEITINDEMTLGRGESAFIAAETAVRLNMMDNSQLFIASSNLSERKL